MKQRVLKLSALRVAQRADVPLFAFGVEGRLIRQFASVQGATRRASGELIGYQRARVEGHIRQILEYLKSQEALLPNAIVLALSDEVAFQPLEGTLFSGWGTFGTLLIPIPVPGASKPALIVDGQQRVSALAQLKPERAFPVIVVGFQAPSAEFEREQFVLVNKTRPLPRDLLNELLPHIGSGLPGAWRFRKVAGQVVEALRFDPASPFYGRIRGLGTSGEGANISQAAVLGVIERSLRRGILERVPVEP